MANQSAKIALRGRERRRRRRIVQLQITDFRAEAQQGEMHVDAWILLTVIRIVIW